MARPEIEVRWHVWALAVEAGWPQAGTYDWCLHPSTRRPLVELLAAYPQAADVHYPGEAATA